MVAQGSVIRLVRAICIACAAVAIPDRILDPRHSYRPIATPPPMALPALPLPAGR